MPARFWAKRSFCVIISACSHDASLLDATAVSIAAMNQFRFLWGPTSLFTSPRKESSIFFQKSDKGFARPDARWKEDSRSVWNHQRDLPRAIVNNKALLWTAEQQYIAYNYASILSTCIVTSRDTYAIVEKNYRHSRDSTCTWFVQIS